MSSSFRDHKLLYELCLCNFWLVYDLYIFFNCDSVSGLCLLAIVMTIYNLSSLVQSLASATPSDLWLVTIIFILIYTKSRRVWIIHTTRLLSIMVEFQDLWVTITFLNTNSQILISFIKYFYQNLKYQFYYWNN